jgi:hypothetical protein
VREERVTEQIHKLIASLVVPDSWLHFFESELSSEKGASRATVEREMHNLSERLLTCDSKLARFLDLLAEGRISHEEYVFKRDQIASERVLFKTELMRFERNSEYWFEPETEFVRDLNQATDLNSSGNSFQKLQFLAKIGSNLSIRDGFLTVDWKKGWNCAITQPREHVSVKGTASKNTSLPTLRTYWNRVRTELKHSPEEEIPASKVASLGDRETRTLRNPNVLAGA